MKVVPDETYPRQTSDYVFPVPNYQFDQKNEVFKRRVWDEKIIPYGERLYNQVRYRNIPGYRKLDYAFRNAAWNVEFEFGFGTVQGNKGLYSWTQIPEKVRPFFEAGGQVRNSPEDNSVIIKKAARFFGADLVGICRAHKNLIYSHEYNPLTGEYKPVHIPEECYNVVVIAIAMDYNAIKYSPNAISGAATGLGYSRQAVVANLLAVFIRGLGYRAMPCGNDTAISIPLAIAAGLGELGRSGLLVTREYGPRVRLCKVFTDMPLVYDRYQPFGIREFCKVCKKCAKYCPAQAISFGNPTIEGPTISNHSGVLKWYINPEKCYAYWSKNRMDCANCIRVCPLNKPPGMSTSMVRFVVSRKINFLNRILLWTDDILGFGKSPRKRDFWI